MKSVRQLVLAASLLMCGNSIAWAQTGGIQFDESSGNWAAAHHSEDDIHSDVCIAASNGGRLIFRADKDDIEVRTTNSSWSLATGTTGDLKISIGDASKTVSMTAVQPDMLAGDVDPADAKALFDAMDKASSADLLFGTKTHETVSLDGSTKALNSFRACAVTAGFADLGGAAGKQSTPF